MSADIGHNDDLQHLKLLAIFHYIVGGLAGLCACIPIFHLVFGILMIVAPEGLAGPRAHPPPVWLGWLFLIMGGSAILFGWIFAVCLTLAGRFLSQRKHYLFCLVMGAVACIFNPFGTVLGIFTIIVLGRPSVKALFTAPSVSLAGPP